MRIALPNTAYNMKPPVGARLLSGHRLCDNLIGCYTMAEGGGTRLFDSTGRAIPATKQGTPTWAPGKYGSTILPAASGDYYNAGSTPLTNIGTLPWSIVAWINLQAAPATKSAIVNTLFPGGSFKGVLFGVGNNSGAYYMRVETYDGSVNPAGFGNTALSGSLMGIWAHVACVWDKPANLYRFYLNGIADGTVGGQSSGDVSGDVTSIGGNGQGGAGNYEPAKIDGVWVYNRVLSPKEIQDHMLGPWSMFVQPNRFLLDSAAGGTDATVSASVGTATAVSAAASLAAGSTLLSGASNATSTAPASVISAGSSLLPGTPVTTTRTPAASLSAGSSPVAQVADAAPAALGLSLSAGSTLGGGLSTVTTTSPAAALQLSSMVAPGTSPDATTVHLPATVTPASVIDANTPDAVASAKAAVLALGVTLSASVGTATAAAKACSAFQQSTTLIVTTLTAYGDGVTLSGGFFDDAKIGGGIA